MDKGLSRQTFNLEPRVRFPYGVQNRNKMKKEDFKKLYIGLEVFDTELNEPLEIRKCDEVHNIWAVTKGTFLKEDTEGTFEVDGTSCLYCIDENCDEYDGEVLEFLN